MRVSRKLHNVIIEGKEVKKVIVVPGKLVNFVLG